MKKTLLQLVQGILNDADSDNVNSIDDTVEALQAVEIIRNTYFLMMANRDWPHTRKLIQLDSAADIDKPNYLKLPERLKRLDLFKYEKQKDGDTRKILEKVTYMHPDEFLDHISQRNSDNANVELIEDFSGARLLIFNNYAPQYFTSFDDEYLVTDSYDSAVDATLQQDKTQAVAYIVPMWNSEDDFVPDLPIEAFPALEEEAKSTFFVTIKQVVNQKAEQNSVRQNRWLARKAWRAHGGVRYDNYGRKSRT